MRPETVHWYSNCLIWTPVCARAKTISDKSHDPKLIEHTILLAFVFTLLSFQGQAQKHAPKKDTTNLKDSLLLYKKIKHWAYKHKLTTFAYDAVFVDPEPKEYPKQVASKEEKNVNPYLKYEGKIIKDIKVTVYDPFGHNVNDTLTHSINASQRFGNRMHITTRKFVVINKLLFKKNDTINPLSLSETERVLRQAVFVNDARVYISESTNKDSVIVNVVVHDKWPITIPTLVTDIFVDVKFRNYNLFGVGQQFEQNGRWTRPGEFAFNGYYGIANIDNTYISSVLSYVTNKELTSVGLSFDRPFFSPLTPWAGGVSVGHTWRTWQYTDSIVNETKKIPLNSLSFDLWAGKSFKLTKLSKDKSFFNQSTNIIAGTRYYSTVFVNRPSTDVDTNKTNYNTYAALGNIGFSVQKYYKDQFIYRFGANEDVPEGLILQLIYGGLKYEFKKVRYYLGTEIARAKHFNFGYLSATFSYGIFFNEKVPNDITTNYKLYYFSNLLKNGRWLFREFVNFNVVHGENKLAGETINFSGDELYGFENGTLSGNTKMSLNSETVAYLPYQLIGFRFAPVVTAAVGMIGSPSHRFTKSNLYQAYTIGVLVRNENLLSSTFQFSVGAYPFFPDNGKFSVKYNPIASFTLRVRAFAISKPEFVSY